MFIMQSGIEVVGDDMSCLVVNDNFGGSSLARWSRG